ncbi:hypothetical protein PUN28_003759 [Cardiocondyla obscurior]|uniref:Uncharacterized protein n=1 Tax=Cardiocondyla obscurior TaxID=286306 RepID=A0AAW2GK52_9HYME
MTDNRSNLISTSILFNLSIVSKNFSKCLCSSFFIKFALRAGPEDWYIDCNFNHKSCNVLHSLTCFNSEGLIERIMSAFALPSSIAHFCTTSNEVALPSDSGFTLRLLAYSQVSFFVNNACIWILQVSKLSRLSNSMRNVLVESIISLFSTFPC